MRGQEQEGEVRAAAAATSRGKGGSGRYTWGGGEQAAGGACHKTADYWLPSFLFSASH